MLNGTGNQITKYISPRVHIPR
jgi:hypothetical protein